MRSQTFASCYVKYDSDSLVIGNSRLERTWAFGADLPISINIIDKVSGKEWLADASLCCCNLVGLGSRIGDCEIDADDDMGCSAEALRVRVPFHHSNGKLEWTHLVYPDVGFIRSYWRFVPVGGGTKPGGGVPATGGQASLPVPTADVRPSQSMHTADPPSVDTLELFTLAPLHVRWRAVTLRDVTDRNNNLVSEEHGLLYCNEKRLLQGNLAFFTDVLDKNGLIVIKEAATPLAQLHYPGHDFALAGSRLTVVGSGLTDHDFAAGEPVTAYGVAVGVCQEGDAGALFALQEYHRSLHRPVPERDYFVMSNTWGDRARDSRVSEAFVLDELSVAAKLGISIYHIDDGWQKGRTSNSAEAGGTWNGFYAADSNFWQPHPERFPQGLRPIAKKAAELGVKLGLWFAPDSSDDFANWEKDAATLLNLNMEHDITYFKLDAVKLRSKLGEERFVRMMQHVIRRSAGRVAFNLDTTAEVRLGYYGRSHYGTLFLENRYTDLHSYFPHLTLRNLWMLARYVPAGRLQMEFLNIRRNQDKYGDDPLSPTASGMEYAFATTVCANPLAWMELTGLTADDQRNLAKLIGAYRPHQAAMLSAVTLPIGEEPDGTVWTGFQSIVDDRSGYLVIMRERNRSTRHRFQLWRLENCRIELQPILGVAQERRLEIDSRGETWITLPHPQSFAIYRYFRP